MMTSVTNRLCVQSIAVNSGIKNKIISSVKDLLKGLAKASVTTNYDLSSKVSLRIDTFKVDDGKAQLGFYFTKKEELSIW